MIALFTKCTKVWKIFLLSFVGLLLTMPAVAQNTTDYFYIRTNGSNGMGFGSGNNRYAFLYDDAAIFINNSGTALPTATANNTLTVNGHTYAGYAAKEGAGEPATQILSDYPQRNTADVTDGSLDKFKWKFISLGDSKYALQNMYTKRYLYFNPSEAAKTVDGLTSCRNVYMVNEAPNSANSDYAGYCIPMGTNITWTISGTTYYFTSYPLRNASPYTQFYSTLFADAGGADLYLFKYKATTAPLSTATIMPAGGSTCSNAFTVNAMDYTNRNSAENFKQDTYNGTYGIYNAGWVNSENWAEYKIEPCKAGTYKVTGWIAMPDGAPSNNTLRTGSSSGAVLGTLTCTTANGWQNYGQYTTNITLSAGAQSIWFVAGASLNFLRMTFEYVPAPKLELSNISAGGTTIAANSTINASVTISNTGDASQTANYDVVFKLDNADAKTITKSGTLTTGSNTTASTTYTAPNANGTHTLTATYGTQTVSINFTVTGGVNVDPDLGKTCKIITDNSLSGFTYEGGPYYIKNDYEGFGHQYLYDNGENASWTDDGDAKMSYTFDNIGSIKRNVLATDDQTVWKGKKEYMWVIYSKTVGGTKYYFIKNFKTNRFFHSGPSNYAYDQDGANKAVSVWAWNDGVVSGATAANNSTAANKHISFYCFSLGTAPAASSANFVSTIVNKRYCWSSRPMHGELSGNHNINSRANYVFYTDNTYGWGTKNWKFNSAVADVVAPDLKITNVIANESVIGIGESFTATITIKNDGTEAIASGTPIKVKVTFNGGYFITQYTGGLGIGASATLPAFAITPSDLTGADGEILTVKVNSDYSITETVCNDASNVYTTTAKIKVLKQPEIALKNHTAGQVAAADVNIGSPDNVAYRFMATVVNKSATLNTFSFVTSGTALLADITNFKIYYSLNADFSNPVLLGTITAATGAGTHSLTGLTQALPTGDVYFKITTDISLSATAGRTLSVSAIAANNMTIAAGTVTGSTATAGGAQTISLLVTPPTAKTYDATNIATTSAQLNGEVFANNATATASIEFGTTTAYGTTITPTPSSIAAISTISATVSSLTPNTLYHYRIVASNSKGSVNGNDITFATKPSVPTVGKATAIGAGSFTANWTAPTGQGSVAYTYTVQVSTQSNFSSIAKEVPGVSSTSTAITGLAGNTTYYFRVQIVNAQNMNSGYSAASASFLTDEADPYATACTAQTAFNSTLANFTFVGGPYYIRNNDTSWGYQYLYDNSENVSLGDDGDAKIPYTFTNIGNVKRNILSTDDQTKWKGKKEYMWLIYSRVVNGTTYYYIKNYNTGRFFHSGPYNQYYGSCDGDNNALCVWAWNESLAGAATALNNASATNKHMSFFSFGLGTAPAANSADFTSTIVTKRYCWNERLLHGKYDSDCHKSDSKGTYAFFNSNNWNSSKWAFKSAVWDGVPTDLQVTKVDVSDNTVSLGDSFTAKVTIKNTGTVAIPNTAEGAIKIKFNFNGKYYTATYSSGLAVGATAEITQTITPHKLTEAVDGVALEVTVNCDCAIKETSVDNTLSSSKIKVMAIPEITIANLTTGQVAAADVSVNSENNTIYTFRATVTSMDVKLTAFNFTTAGNATASDINNFKVYYSSNANFTSPVLLGTITTGTGSGSHSLTGLTQVLPVGESYFKITADIKSSSTATAGHSFAVSAVAVGNLTLNTGTKLGTTTAGGIQTIIVITLPPKAVTNAATNITTTSAKLNGQVSANLSPVSVASFEYGITTAYNLTAEASPMSITEQDVNISANITGLTSNTVYNFRAYALNAKGEGRGDNVTFTTVSKAPVIGVPTLPVAGGFTASWSAPSGQGTAAYTYTVQVSENTNFSVIAKEVTLITTTSTAITGLGGGKTYYFRVKIENAGGASDYSAVSAAIITDDVDTDTGSCTSYAYEAPYDYVIIQSTNRNGFFYDDKSGQLRYTDYSSWTTAQSDANKNTRWKLVPNTGNTKYRFVNVATGNIISSNKNTYFGHDGTRNWNSVTITNDLTEDEAYNYFYLNDVETESDGKKIIRLNNDHSTKNGDYNNYFLNTSRTTAPNGVAFDRNVAQSNLADNTRNFRFSYFTEPAVKYADLYVSKVELSDAIIGIGDSFTATVTIANKNDSKVADVPNGTAISVKFEFNGKIYTTTYTGGLAMGASVKLPAQTITPHKTTDGVSLKVTINNDFKIKELDCSAASNVFTTTEKVEVIPLLVLVSSIDITAPNNKWYSDINEVTQLSATILPEDAYNSSVTWSSGNTAVATVSQSGLVTAKGPGTTTITVKANDRGGVTGTHTFTTRVALPAITVAAGTNSAIVSWDPIVGANAYTLWLYTSLNPETPVIVYNGITTTNTQFTFTGLASKTTYYVKAQATHTLGGQVNSDVTDAVTFMTKNAPSLLTLSPRTIQTNIGRTHQLDVMVSPSGASDLVNWGSSQPAVATVSNSGLVSAVGLGKTNINVYAVDDHNVNDFTVVYVKLTDPEVTGITFKNNTAVIAWTPVSSADSYALYLYNNTTCEGTATTYTSTSAVITVPVTSGNSYSYKLIAVSNIADANSLGETCRQFTYTAVSDLTLNGCAATIYNGATLQLTATVSPDNASNQKITWSSDKTSVATVSQTGLVSAIGVGNNVTISATTEDGNIVKTCQFNVAEAVVTGVELNRTSQYIMLGNNTQSLTATVLPLVVPNRNVTWKSSDNTVATVDASGKITTLKAGTATITATSAANTQITATCLITVIYTDCSNETYATWVDGPFSIKNNYRKTYLYDDNTNNTKTEYSSSDNTSKSDGTSYSNMGYVLQGTSLPATNNEAYLWNLYSYKVGSTTYYMVRNLKTKRFMHTGAWGDQYDNAGTNNSLNTYAWNATLVADATAITGDATSTTADKANKELSYYMFTLPAFSSDNNPVAGYKEVKGAAFGAAIQEKRFANGSRNLHAEHNYGAASKTYFTTNTNGWETKTWTFDPVNVCEKSTITNVTGITTLTEALTLQLDETFDITVTVVPANADYKGITWSSSNQSVAKVDQNGHVISGGTAGTATITATTLDGGFKANVVITYQPITQYRLALDGKASNVLNANGNFTVNVPCNANVAQLQYSNDNGLTWKNAIGYIVNLATYVGEKVNIPFTHQKSYASVVIGEVQVTTGGTGIVIGNIANVGGAAEKITASVTGVTTNATYQWRESLNASMSSYKIVANTKDCSLSLVFGEAPKYYQLVVTDGYCRQESNVVTAVKESYTEYPVDIAINHLYDDHINNNIKVEIQNWGGCDLLKTEYSITIEVVEGQTKTLTTLSIPAASLVDLPANGDAKTIESKFTFEPNRSYIITARLSTKSAYKTKCGSESTLANNTCKIWACTLDRSAETIQYYIDNSYVNNVDSLCTLHFKSLKGAIDHLKSDDGFLHKDPASKIYNELTKNVVFNIAYTGVTYNSWDDISLFGGQNPEVDYTPIKGLLIEGINNTENPSKYLTIRGTTSGMKPEIEHPVLRNSKNIILTNLRLVDSSIRDNALDIDNGKAYYEGVEMQGGLKNANILVSDCEISCDSRVGVMISGVDGCTLRNNQIVAKSTSTNTDTYGQNNGAAVKIMTSKNVKLERNNIYSEQTTAIWAQNNNTVLLMNNIIQMPNYQNYPLAGIRLLNRNDGKVKDAATFAIYYNTLYIKRGYNNSETQCFIDIAGQRGGYGADATTFSNIRMKYNNFYGENPYVKTYYSYNGVTPEVLLNNFYLTSDRLVPPLATLTAIGNTGNYKGINVKGQLCSETVASSNAFSEFAVIGSALNLGSHIKANSLDDILGASAIYDDRIRQSIRPIAENSTVWTLGAYQSAGKITVDTIVWTNAAGDSNWDNYSNWIVKSTKQQLDCNMELSKTIVAIFPAPEDSKYFNEKISGYPDLNQAPIKVKYSDDLYVYDIIIEYGASLLIEPLLDKDTRTKYYHSVQTDLWITDRKAWQLIGPNVDPLSMGGGTRYMISGDYYLNKTPWVYMHELTLVTVPNFKAIWKDPFKDYYVMITPNRCFAIKTPDEYGENGLMASYVYKNDPYRDLGKEPVLVRFNGRFQPENATTYDVDPSQFVMMCNTFMSSINAEKLLDENGGSIAIWDVDGISFDTYDMVKIARMSSPLYIKPMQAFAYKSETQATTIQLSESVCDVNVNYRKFARATSLDPMLTIHASATGLGNSYADFYYDRDEKGINNMSKLFVGPDPDTKVHAPDIFCYSASEYWQRQAFTDLNTQIYFGVNLAKAATVTFTIDGIDEFDEVYLDDKLLDVTYNLKTEELPAMNLDAGENRDRFVVRFATSVADPTVDIDRNNEEKGLKIYTEDNKHIVVSAPLKTQIKDISITDLSGRVIKVKANADSYTKIDMSAYPAGIYTVKATTNNETKTTKIVIQ